MADPSDILIVRQNTNEPDNVDPYTDIVIGDLIDADGVAGASAIIWERKAAVLASSVDVTEAGASHKNSDLSKNALVMADRFRKQMVVAVTATDRPVVRQIER